MLAGKGHPFYGEAWYCSYPVYVYTYEQQISFSIICHVLSHFLFLYNTVSILKLRLYFSRSVMETLKVHY